MGTLLNISGSVMMAAFLFLLVWRGVSELGWMPKKYHSAQYFPQVKDTVGMQRLVDTKVSVKEQVFFFLFAIVSSWFALWVAFGLWQQLSPSNMEFFDYCLNRFRTAGDAPHYLYIAENGYASVGEQMRLIVFYPFYPFCIWVLKHIVGNAALAGLLISHLCWGAVAVVVRRFVGALSDTATARVATLAMIWFPFNFFALGVFTESAFLLVTLLCLEALYAKRFVRAGVFGFCSALCRTQGVLVLLAALYVFVCDAHEHAAEHNLTPEDTGSFTLWGAICREAKTLVAHWKKALPLLLMPAGYGVYLCLNRYYCGSFSAFIQFEKEAPWYQSVRWIGGNLAQHWEMAQANPGLAAHIYWPQLVLYFAVMAFLIYAVLAGGNIPFLLYAGAYIGMSYLSSWMISGSRYVFGCVALYLLMHTVRQREVRGAILGAEIVFLLYYSLCQIQGQAIM